MNHFIHLVLFQIKLEYYLIKFHAQYIPAQYIPFMKMQVLCSQGSFKCFKAYHHHRHVQ